MKKLSILKNERLARLLTSLLLCMGVLLPLMVSFGAGSADTAGRACYKGDLLHSRTSPMLSAMSFWLYSASS